MNKIKSVIFASVVLTMVFWGAVSGFCGYLITDADGARAMVSNGKIKSVAGDTDDETVIMDLKKGEIIMLDDSKKTATRTSIDDFCAMMDQVGSAMAQAMEQFREQSGGSGQFEIPGLDSGPGDVRVEKSGPGGAIAGYDTQKFRVFADGELYEELWITTDKKLIAEAGGLDKIARFEKCANQAMGQASVESHPDYISLITSGWLLKSVSHEDGVPETMVDVRSIESRKISDSEFAIPGDYRQVGFEEMLQMDPN